MWYFRIEGDNRKFGNIKYARKAAIDMFAYYNDIGEKNPVIQLYEGNVVGEWKSGRIIKGPGYPIYIARDGTRYRLSKSGDARRLKDEPAPFGL